MVMLVFDEIESVVGPFAKWAASGVDDAAKVVATPKWLWSGGGWLTTRPNWDAWLAT